MAVTILPRSTEHTRGSRNNVTGSADGGQRDANGSLSRIQSTHVSMRRCLELHRNTLRRHLMNGKSRGATTRLHIALLIGDTLSTTQNLYSAM